MLVPRSVTLSRLITPSCCRFTTRFGHPVHLYSTMTSPLFKTYLIPPSKLSPALQSTNTLKILCASWFLPNSPHTGQAVYAASRIPNARFFDLDAVKDPSSPYPHMLSSASDFASAMGKLGIKKTDTVVVYDSKELGLFSAPRVAWMLKGFGHEHVHILDNFKVWCEQGYPVEEGEPQPLKAEDEVEYGNAVEPSNVAGYDEMVEGAKSRFDGTTVLDARPKGRFTGEAPEPRPGLSSGHMPGSVSLPFVDVLDPITKQMLPKEELRKIFKERGVEDGKPVITSCGTGVTAAVLDTALEVAGYGERQRKLFDGSWSMYAALASEEQGLIEKGYK